MYCPNSNEIESIKLSVRFTSKTLNTEIRETINAALFDLETSGVNTETQPAAMVLQAVKSYCRAYYNYNGQGDKWRSIYKEQRTKLELNSAGESNE